MSIVNLYSFRTAKRRKTELYLATRAFARIIRSYGEARTMNDYGKSIAVSLNEGKKRISDDARYRTPN